MAARLSKQNKKGDSEERIKYSLAAGKKQTKKNKRQRLGSCRSAGAKRTPPPRVTGVGGLGGVGVGAIVIVTFVFGGNNSRDK